MSDFKPKSEFMKQLNALRNAKASNATESINRQDAIDALKICDANYVGANCYKCPLRDERWDGAWTDNVTNCHETLMRDSAKLLESCEKAESEAYLELPSADTGNRVFKAIVVEYPKVSTYKEYEGKPYFSIKYIEDGQKYIGYGTYNPEVLSEYLRKYFMPSAEPEDYTEMKREFIRMASYIDVLLECSDEQKETLMGYISRLSEYMPWTERD